MIMSPALNLPIFISNFEDLHQNEVQISLLPVKLMKLLGTKINDIICIKVNSEKEIICKVFPTISSDCRHGFQVIVSCNVINNISHIKDFHFEKEIRAHTKEIFKLNTVKIAKVSLNVVMNSVESVMKARKDLEAFHDDIKDLLKMHQFKENSIINCSTNPLGKLLGILYLVIDKVYVTDSDRPICNWVGHVAWSTSVDILNIESKERHVFLIENQTFLGGLDHILDDLKSLVNDSWLLKEEFSKAGVIYPSGVLLIGPPGCGKSSLVRQLCYQTHACLIATAGAELQSPYEGEVLINFTKVAKKACLLSKEGPCILFIDEIDSLCPSRSSDSSVEDLRLTSQVLLILDECKSYPSLLIMAATNRPFALDHAVRRSGRLEIEILLNAPTLEERKCILGIHSQGLLPPDHPSLSDIAAATPGFVGADLQLLCERAKDALSPSNDICAAPPPIPIASFVSSEMLRLCSAITPSIHKTLEFITTKPLASPVGGLDRVKARLDLLLSHHDKYKRFYSTFKLKRPKGILLFGPRGCGKTRLVSLLASQRGFTFLSATASHLLSPFVGESEKRIAALFHSARLAQPAIVFIDEIDGIFGSRDSVGGGVRVNLLTELLQAMDGADVGATSRQGAGQMKSKIQDFKDDVVVCAATNHPDRLDAALLRPGRFDHVIYVPPPDREARRDILKLKTSKLEVDQDLLERIADESEGWTGAELENLISQAAMQAVVESRLEESSQRIVIPDQVIWEVFTRSSPSLTHRELSLFSDFEAKLSNFIQMS